MLIQGFVSYHSNNWSSQSGEQHSISWEGGFLNFSEPGKSKTANDAFVVGFQGKNKSDVKLWGVSPVVLTSLSDFQALIPKLGDKLAAGIWIEESNGQVHLARHIFGLHTLYYTHIPGEFFAFSSNLHGLLSLLKDKQLATLNEARLKSFLTFSGDMQLDYNGETFYEHVKCVFPGHVLTAGAESVTARPFTKFEIPPLADSLPDFAARFKTLLTDAVTGKLPADGTIMGSHLSGGLDSSSVSTLARLYAPENPLHTFYYNTQGEASDDKDFAHEVARNIHSSHHEILLSEKHLEAIQQHTAILGYPQPTFVSPSFQKGVYELASQLGCEVLFNGNGGDSVVGSGFEYPALLYQQKDWALLKDLLTKRTQFFSKAGDFPNWDKLTFEEQTQIVEQNFLYRQISRSLRIMGPAQLPGLYRELTAHFKLSPQYFGKRGLSAVWKKLKGKSIQPITLLRDDFLESAFKKRPKLSGLSTLLRGDVPATFQASFEEIYNHHTIFHNENRSILAADYGLESRSPFFDKELFELCMAVPEVTKYGNGLGRMHFREAMKGILPEKVRLRSQKTHIGPRGRLSTLALYDQSQELLNDTSEIWQYVDRRKFEGTVKFLKTENIAMDEYTRSLFHVTRTISVAAWLEWLKSENYRP
ncbi:asparagine synthetase B [Dyadobacter beijingensis]|uniref:asparagine synthase (glutamine-hydrolyzing) n=1 Tax=Dyadobacter beijingensis TaxID=365489 RepID=A0ABQ2HFR3_9BACT|nr:asparagine synthase-related protein [Dyadobacter beijingensis]GGM76980.1 asparagine synthetase B [Dyadobacter beijingensis]